MISACIGQNAKRALLVLCMGVLPSAFFALLALVPQEALYVVSARHEGIAEGCLGLEGRCSSCKPGGNSCVVIGAEIFV